MIDKTRQSDNQAARFVLPHLETEVKHLPGQTATFIDALAAFVANQEDVTSLRVYNLREMAKNLRMSYERIDNLLSRLDTFTNDEPGAEQ